MNKGMKYFTEGMLAAFVLAPRVPVQAIEPATIPNHRTVGNASKHWESVGKSMTTSAKKIQKDYVQLNSL